jgi:hypothetical protein
MVLENNKEGLVNAIEWCIAVLCLDDEDLQFKNLVVELLNLLKF